MKLELVGLGEQGGEEVEAGAEIWIERYTVGKYTRMDEVDFRLCCKPCFLKQERCGLIAKWVRRTGGTRVKKLAGKGPLFETRGETLCDSSSLGE